ncbi:MAG TPA: hypothetical protein VJN72_12005 [Gaiellales bacterium]|nr:hypothetical protein [Gaiellales bacterium]
MSMSRVIRHVAGFAIVLAISAQVAQAAPNHLTWNGEQVGPKHGPMVYTPSNQHNELVLGGTVRQPNALIHVTDQGGGSGFGWGDAAIGAASMLGIMLVSGGAAAGVRNRRRVAVS